MKSMLQSILKIQPWHMGTGELFLGRLFIGLIIWQEFFFGFFHAEQTMPVGLAHFIDLSFLQNGQFFEQLYRLFLLATALFVLGVTPALSTGYMLFIMSAVGSLRNSYGNIHHGTQVVAMVIMGYWLAYVWGIIRSSPNGEPRLSHFLKPKRETHQRAMWWAFQAAVATYVVAGVSKLRISGLSWISDLPYMSLHIEKIGWQHFYGTGEEALLIQAQEMSALVAGHPWLTRIIVGSGLFLELFAFIALFGRWHAAIMGITLVGMHVMISRIMQLDFPLNNWVLIIYFINLPFLILWLSKHAFRCFSGKGSSVSVTSNTL
jgi:hypothetical protein